MNFRYNNFEEDFDKALDIYFETMKVKQSNDRVVILILTWLVRALAVRNENQELAKSHFKEARKWFDELGERLFQ